MLRLIIVRPGSTELDEQGRIKGSLNIPLSETGCAQADKTAGELHAEQLRAIYSSPCESAQQTATRLSRVCQTRVKTLEQLQNLDRGLWNGKRIEELKQTQPKLYRRWQEHPETVRPPRGETLEGAQQRVRKALQKIVRKQREGAVAVVVPEPLATIAISILRSTEPGNLWKAECCCGHWESIDIEPNSAALS